MDVPSLPQAARAAGQRAAIKEQQVTSMTPEQQLIQQIKQLIEHGEIDRNPLVEDYAEQFAELCRSANERLLRCRDYIEKGMRSEAVHEAHTAPDLLVLSELLQFEGLKKWRNICADMELAVFQPLNEELLAKLRAECVREQELTPLLKEYRRLVYQGDRKGCITVLRQIREKDPDNPSWAGNLQPLEEETMAETVAAVEEAIGKKDLSRLKVLYDDLTSPYRVVAPPADVLRNMRLLLMHDRAEALHKEGSAVLQRLQKALANDVPEELEVVTATAEKLAADEAFLHIPDGWETALSAARDKLAAIARREQKKAEFSQAVAVLQEQLTANELSELALRHEWERLCAWEMPVPELLRRQVMETLDDMQTRRRRRERNINAVIVISTLLLLLLLGTFLHFRITQRRRAAIFTEMERMYSTAQYEQLSRYMAHIARVDPDFMQSLQVRSMRQGLIRALRELNKAGERYDRAMASLESIRENAYEGASAESIEQLLAEATAMAYDDEEKNQVEIWRRTWQSWQQRQRRDADNELQRLLGLYNTARQDAKKQPYADLAREHEKISELTLAFKQSALRLAAASDAVAQAFHEANEDLGVWERDWAQRRNEDVARQQRLQVLQGDIPRALPDLQRYFLLLQEYCELAPTAPETLHYRRLLDQRQHYEKVAALNSVTVGALPLPADQMQMLQQLLAEQAQGSVWESDLQRCLAMADERQAMLGQINAMLALNPDMLNVTTLRYRHRGGPGMWQLLYSPKPLIEGKERNENNEETRIFFGNIYYFRNDDMPTLVHTKDVFPNRLNERDFEIDIKRQAQDNLCAHARFLYQLVAEANEAPLPAVHLLNSLDSLVANQDIEPIPKLWLLRAIMDVLQTHCRTQLPECAAWLEFLDGIDSNTPWMNPDYPPTKEANARIKRRIAELPAFSAFATRMQTSLRVMQEALNAKPRCVGCMQVDSPGELKPILSEAQPGELWVLVAPSGQQAPYFLMLAGNDLSLRSDALRVCFPGILLFTPARKQGSANRLISLGVSDADKAVISKPASWPANVW
jgi:hypothetical protein